MLFVLNTGRAGSRTIANVLSQHPELASTHEPLPRLIEETVEYRYGRFPADDLAALLAESRPPAVDGRRYCETANRLSLTVPGLASTFPDAQVIWLMRDGRDVVSSGMQRGWFDPSVVKDTPWERHRLRGDELGEISADEWAEWSPFRRVSWLWRRTNEIIETDLEALDADRSMKLRLEDLSDRMDDVAEFLDIEPINWVVPRQNARAAIPDTGPATANQVKRRYDHNDWSEQQHAEFVAECGSMMDSWYPGWQSSEPPAVPAEEPVDPTTAALRAAQVDLADLRVLRAELGLLTAHAIRGDHRIAALRGENARLLEKNHEQNERLQQLHERLHRRERAAIAAGEAASREKAALDEATALATRAKKELADTKTKLGRAEKRVALVEASESFRLGHRIVQTLTFPVRSARAVRRRVRRMLGTAPAGKSKKTGGSKNASSSSKTPTVAVAPDPDVGFADLDRLDPTAIDPGALTSFRLTVSSVEDAGGRIEAALRTLAPEGVGEILVPSDTAAERLRSVLDVIRDQESTVRIETRNGSVALVVGNGSPNDESLTEAAVLQVSQVTETLAAAKAEASRLAKALETERKTNAARLEKAHDSTQYRIGAAVLDVVHNPLKAVKLPREIIQLQRRRSRPEVAPAKSVEVAPTLDMKVLSILDEFTHDCFAPEFDLVPADRTNWRSQLEGASLLFVESAWRGNGGTWNYTLNKFEKNGGDVQAVIDAARAAGIPSLFWNKEDPVSFDVFLPAARAFDGVLTTDRNMVDDYRSALGHERVDALAFAAQPRIHNPVGRPRGAEVAGRVCFAGSWRGDKYAQRGSDFDTLLGPPLERGALDIYDRYASGPDAEKLGFPEPFRSAVVGSLPYSEMGNAYRRYAAFLNVNSVQDSPTMFSRRVFELLACGTPVISTPAQGIDEMLGDTVLVTDSREKTAEYVEWVLNEPEQRDQHAHRGYRLVHREHSYQQRVDAMLQHVGVAVTRPRRRVSVICVSNRPAMLDHAIGNYLRQSYADREFVFVANSSEFDTSMLASIEARVPGARVLQIDDSATLGECLNEALKVAEGEYFAKFDDDDHYGDEYLADLMMTFPYSGAAVAGKQCYYAYLEGQDRTVLRFPGKEYRSAPRVVGGTIVADRAQVSDIAFESVPRGTDSLFLNKVRARGLTVFSADRFNFCQVRHADVTSHTWAIEDEEFLKACDDVGSGFVENAIFL